MKNWVPLFAALVAAAVAVGGYWFTERSKRLDAKAESYAKALAAAESYKQLPYRIRRRTSSDHKVRGELAKMVDDALQEVSFYRRWLFLDSMNVGYAYEAWIKQLYSVGRGFRQQAWTLPPIDKDEAMNFSDYYKYNDVDQQKAVVVAMRNELRGRFRHW